jgi:hypothetical protein
MEGARMILGDLLQASPRRIVATLRDLLLSSPHRVVMTLRDLLETPQDGYFSLSLNILSFFAIIGNF